MGLAVLLEIAEAQAQVPAHLVGGQPDDIDEAVELAGGDPKAGGGRPGVEPGRFSISHEVSSLINQRKGGR